MQPPKRWVVWLLRFLLIVVSVGGLWLTSVQTADIVDIFLRPPATYPPPDDARLRETISEAAARAVVDDDFDTRIRTAIDTDDLVLAEIYLDLAELLGKPLDPTTVQYYRDKTTAWEQTKRQARNCAKGSVRAESGNLTALSCQLGTDLIGIGDVRDIVIEGNHYIKDEPVNKLILGLSVAGLATTMLTVKTLGTAGIIDAGLSVIKLGIRTGRIGAKLRKQLASTFMNVINFPALATVRKQEGVVAVARSLKTSRFLNRAAWTEGARVLDDIGAIRQNGRGLSTAMLALEHSESVTDLRFFRRIGALFGKNTDGIIKVLGRRLFSLGKATAKITIKVAAKLAVLALGMLLSVLGLLGSLFGNLADVLARRWVLGAIAKHGSPEGCL